MSRIINLDTAGKERTHLSKAVVLAVHELGRQSNPGFESRDLTAFIALALTRIATTIELSVQAWEKRDYWIKADRFRMEWEWAGRLGSRMRKALKEEDWPTIAALAVQTGQHLSKITLSDHHRLGQPWVGAWEQLQQEERTGS